MKLTQALVTLGLLILLAAPMPAQAQAERIYLASAQAPSTDQDVWAMRPDGTGETQFTSEATDANAPSVCGDGRTVFYDVGGIQGIGKPGGDLYVKDLFGTPQSVLDCASQDWVCSDVDCGPPVPSSSDPRIVFTLVDNQVGSNIYMATWNVEEQVLENLVALTNDPSAALDNKNLHPAWCRNRVVWSRYTHDQGENNEYTICTMQVDASGAVPGTIVCHDTEAPDSEDGGDELTEWHPSCGVLDGVLKIAYANSKVGGEPYGSHKICTINADFSGPEVCTSDSHPQFDQTMPTWSPGGTQIAYVSDDNGGLGGDYDIYVVNSQDLTGAIMMLGADDSVDDLDPDWGPLVLP